MSILNTETAIIFIIDIQEKLLNAVFNKDTLCKNAKILSQASAILNIPCIITEQYPKGLGITISEISNNINNNNAKYFEKINFNALEDAKILQLLKNYGKSQIILAGIETHICVRQTAEALIKSGFDVSLIKDACGSRSETEYHAGLDLMKQEGAFIKSTETILFELLKSAKHPNFKEVQALIK